MVNQDHEKTERKEYRAPKLITYGDIVEITRNVSNSGMFDSGTGTFTKSALR